MPASPPADGPPRTACARRTGQTPGARREVNVVPGSCGRRPARREAAAGKPVFEGPGSPRTSCGVRGASLGRLSSNAIGQRSGRARDAQHARARAPGHDRALRRLAREARTSRARREAVRRRGPDDRAGRAAHGRGHRSVRQRTRVHLHRDRVARRRRREGGPPPRRVVAARGADRARFGRHGARDRPASRGLEGRGDDAERHHDRQHPSSWREGGREWRCSRPSSATRRATERSHERRRPRRGMADPSVERRARALAEFFAEVSPRLLASYGTRAP